MAVTALVFGNFMVNLSNKLIDIDSDALKVMLLTSSASPNQDTWTWKSDVTNEVAATGGYTAGGQTLTSVAVTYTSGTNTMMIDCADPVWTTSTITARHAIFYDSSPATDATRPLIAWWDFGADVISSGGSFTLTIAAGGLVTAVAA